jgi:hypothetical protein
VQYSAFDRFDVGESWGDIAAACRDAGAPLSRFALNAYMNLNSFAPPSLGLAAAAARALTGLPVVFSEFGVTSSDVYVSVGEQRQGPLLVSAALEGLFDGIPAMDLFTWNDKPFVSVRERGFGLVDDRRKPKPALASIAALQNALSSVDVSALQTALAPEPAAILFLLPQNRDVWNSYWDEAFITAAELQRTGVPVRFITTEQLTHGEAAGARLLVLCHQGAMSLASLQAAAATHVPLAAFAEVPGGARGLTPALRATLREVFGIDAPSVPVPSGEHVMLFDAQLVRGDASAIFSSWQIGPATAAGASEAPWRVDGYTPSSPLHQPLWFAFGKNHYFPIGIGDMAPQIGDDAIRPIPPNGAHEVPSPDQFLVSLIAPALSLPPPVVSLADTTALVRVRGLAGGGHVAFASVLPRLRDSKDTRCEGLTQALGAHGFAPHEKLLGLTTGATLAADADGDAWALLAPCQSELFVNAEALAQWRRPAATRPPAVAARAAAFPPRVLLLAAGGAHCAKDTLVALGYAPATLGIAASPDLKHFRLAPERGYYTDIAARPELFDRVILEGGTSPPSGLAASAKILRVDSCAALDRRALGAWLE